MDQIGISEMQYINLLILLAKYGVFVYLIIMVLSLRKRVKQVEQKLEKIRMELYSRSNKQS